MNLDKLRGFYTQLNNMHSDFIWSYKEMRTARNNQEKKKFKKEVDKLIDRIRKLIMINEDLFSFFGDRDINETSKANWWSDLSKSKPDRFNTEVGEFLERIKEKIN